MFVGRRPPALVDVGVSTFRLVPSRAPTDEPVSVGVPGSDDPQRGCSRHPTSSLGILGLPLGGTPRDRVLEDLSPGVLRGDVLVLSWVTGSVVHPSNTRSLFREFGRDLPGSMSRLARGRGPGGGMRTEILRCGVGT